MIFKRALLIIACMFFTINADAKVLHDRSSNVINPATSDKQTEGNASLSIIEDKTTSIENKVSTEAKQDVGNANLLVIEGDTTSLDDKMGEKQATPTQYTSLGRLKDIWDKLVEVLSKLVDIETNQTDGTQATKIVDANNVNATGEVQATPTENTILDRLKDLWDKLVEVLAKLVDIETNQIDGTQTVQLVNKDNVEYSLDEKLTACIGEKVALSRISRIDKFGRNPDIDTGTDPEDIWDVGGLWVPPTEPKIHNLASTVANDAGTLVSTGTADIGSSTTILYDAAADFVTDAVAIGDAVLNDTNIDHSIVLSIDDLNTLTLEVTHHANFTVKQSATVGFNAGDTYRIVTPANTGASVVHLYGLDSNFDEKEEFIILNGVNPISTIRTYWRVYRMHIDGVDSRLVNNVGDISATAVTDATITAQINAANGQTLMAIYTIPRDKIGCMVQFSGTIYKGAVGALANTTLRQTKFAGLDGAGSIIEHYFGMATDGSSHIHHPFGPYKRFEQQTDIFGRVDTVTANDTQVTLAFDIILVDVN